MNNQPEALTAGERQPDTVPAYGYVIEHREDNVRFYLTNWEKSISVEDMPARFSAPNPQAFLAAQIKHGSNLLAAEFNKRTVEVTVWTEDTRLRRYFLTAAAVKIAVYVYRFNTGKLITGEALVFGRDAQLVNSGLVGIVGLSGNQITITLTPEPFLSNQGVPRFYCQRTCNHVLGSATGCQVDLDSMSHTTTLLEVDRVNRRVTLAANPSPAVNEDYFRNGYFLHSSGVRMPIRTTDLAGPGGLLRFNMGLWNPLMEIGDSITAYPGCRHTIADCRDKFDNLDNFGGFPYVPNKNITAHGL